MKSASLHRFSAFVDLTSREREALRDLMERASTFDVAESIRVEGDDVGGVYFLHEGWVLSTVTYPNGSRQVLKIHRSGDILGAPSLPFETAVESLIALTATKVSTITLNKLGALFVAHPRLAAILYLASQDERVTLMDRLAAGGQLGAQRNLAALLLMLFDGQSSLSIGSERNIIHIPLTQNQIGDVLGLSNVHVSRMMISLEHEGLIKRAGAKGRIYELPDVPRLRNFVGMYKRVRKRNPAWLPAMSV